MKSYIFITTEGYTFQPGSETPEPDIENCQVIGLAQGNNERDAFENLIVENGYLIGTTFDQIRCLELKHKPDENFAHYFYLTAWRNRSRYDSPWADKITFLTGKEQDELIDECQTCYYCGEHFKEADRVVPGLGVLAGQTDVVKFVGKFWHYGCIEDWYKDFDR